MNKLIISLICLNTFQPASAVAEDSLLLPLPLVNAGAATDGRAIYVFGGFHEGALGRVASAAVLRLDPESGRVDRVAELPTPRIGASATWTGSTFLVVGGLNEGGASDEILAFDPSTLSVQQVGPPLPEPLSNAAVAWDGLRLLIAGGFVECRQECPRLSDAIWSFDPKNGTLEPVSARLPYGLSASGFYDGESMYLIGGARLSKGDVTSSPSILRYHPATDRVDVVPQELPQGSMGAGIVWDGQRAFILGGERMRGQLSEEVFAFIPSTSEILLAVPSLPHPRSAAAAATLGGKAFIIGGIGCEGGSRPCPNVQELDLGSLELIPAPASEERQARGIRESPLPGLGIVLAAALVVALVRRGPSLGRDRGEGRALPRRGRGWTGHIHEPRKG